MCYVSVQFWQEKTLVLLRRRLSLTASDKVNAVEKDFNSDLKIRNAISTVNYIIDFRGFVIRRKCSPNNPVFCETHWCHKSKGIVIFNENFAGNVKGLQKL